MKTLKSILAGLVLVVVISLGTKAYQGQIAILQAQVVKAESHIPSPIEIQQMLINKGHNLKLDGIIGKKTLAAWDKEVCNRHADKWFDPNSYSYRKD